MPHECTTCGRQFDDGSKEMLSGCPNCGGNKFQFRPAGRGGAGSDAAPADPPASQSGDDAAPTETEGEPADPVERAPDRAPSGNAADPATAGDAADPDGAEPAEAFDDGEIAEGVGEENRAQSDARSSSATPDEIDESRQGTAGGSAPSGRGTPQGPPTEDSPREGADQFDVSGAVGPSDDDPVEKQPVAGSAPEREDPSRDDDGDLTALREELNEQFESIKITAPGRYELNLMELYDREEYIISLQEDGRYVIEMTESYGMDDA